MDQYVCLQVRATLIPGIVQTSVRVGKVRAALHIFMAFWSDGERNMFLLFLFWKIQKNIKRI